VGIVLLIVLGVMIAATIHVWELYFGGDP
jgi:hypothetical protein